MTNGGVVWRIWMLHFVVFYKSEEELEEIRVILIGKTGAGKSYLGNALMGRELFKSSVTAESVTTFCASGKRKIKSRSHKYILKVIDTPGLKDNRMSEKETCGELARCISLSLPGPHFFVIVIQIGRFTDEELKVVEMLKKEFGVELMNFALVVFTHGFKLSGMSIEKYLETAPAGLQKVVKESDNRYAVLGDQRDRTFQKSVKNIIYLIVNSLGSLHMYYTNEMFNQANENKKLIIARLEEERNKELVMLREELEGLKIKEGERCSKEEKRKIKEEKQRMERELKKTETTSSEDMFDVKVATDNSVVVDTFNGAVLSTVGGIMEMGVGFLTANAVVAGAGLMTVAKSMISLFSIASQN